jgi:hypothetical protein
VFSCITAFRPSTPLSSLRTHDLHVSLKALVEVNSHPIPIHKRNGRTPEVEGRTRQKRCPNPTAATVRAEIGYNIGYCSDCGLLLLNFPTRWLFTHVLFFFFPLEQALSFLFLACFTNRKLGLTYKWW